MSTYDEVLAAIVTELEAAWNAADGERFGRPFTDDADFVNIRGEHHRSRTAIARGHQAIFDSIYKGSVVRYEAVSARAIAPTVLVGLVTATLSVPSGRMAGQLRSCATLVLAEQQGTWHIAAFHNTLVA